ncbi:hypothetical protein [Microbulbifer litoralis]|uniref:hypothetical protein n=1 Tax=Microbulbifer litoralis TaxID=2933965 RepID=UPI0020292F0E|nr:hypothetical protein [Microbulbifer sp. GX H0434]
MLKTIRTIVFSLIFCLLPLSVQAATHFLSSPALPPELGSGQGYLLVHVDAGGSAPSLEFARIRRAGSEPLEVDEPVRFAAKADKLSLKGLEPGFYLLPLRAGQYQFTRVNAPYYDLPYWMGTDLAANWRFVIEEGRTNYIGDVEIRKERASNSVDTNLLNRIAIRKPEIEAAMPDLLIDCPLSFNAGYRDDFFRALIAADSVGESAGKSTGESAR